ncbi:hypothetical protein PhCBS80983_g06465 [Powellomyces hirtus]|uniref:Uncharacterized protein n=1 Tax=Powellomyces hirtus TaxID=109895 RepID=A0A507DN19_9FUNG|nr:hypothetical protein PhCBS80983_g06465 [Powellomyces hirtus]
MSLTQACKEAIWLRQLLIELGYPQGLRCQSMRTTRAALRLPGTPQAMPGPSTLTSGTTLFAKLLPINMWT